MPIGVIVFVLLVLRKVFFFKFYIAVGEREMEEGLARWGIKKSSSAK